MKNNTYEDKDFVDVEIEGEVQRVPKTWLGTDLLPAGTAKAGSGSDDEVTIPEGDPSDSWTNKQLDAYAAAHEIDLGGAGNKADKLEAIKKASLV